MVSHFHWILLCYMVDYMMVSWPGFPAIKLLLAMTSMFLENKLLEYSSWFLQNMPSVVVYEIFNFKLISVKNITPDDVFFVSVLSLANFGLTFIFCLKSKSFRLAQPTVLCFSYTSCDEGFKRDLFLRSAGTVSAREFVWKARPRHDGCGFECSPRLCSVQWGGYFKLFLSLCKPLTRLRKYSNYLPKGLLQPYHDAQSNLWQSEFQ